MLERSGEKGLAGCGQGGGGIAGRQGSVGGGRNTFWINQKIKIGLVAQIGGFTEIRNQRESLERRRSDTVIMKTIGEAVKFLHHVAEAVRVIREALFQRDAQIIRDKRSGVALAQTMQEVQGKATLIEPMQKRATLICIERREQGEHGEVRLVPKRGKDR